MVRCVHTRRTCYSFAIAMSLLATLPGIIAFIIARQIRTDDLTQNEEVIHNRQTHADIYDEEGAFTLFTDKKHYSGYYGLICIPTYTILTLIGLLITSIK
jgi:hypothetical protein